MNAAIAIPPEQLDTFCRKWRIAELRLFGSALHGEVGPDSDVDLLVTFAPDAHWGLLDHAAMERELSALLGREVDLVSRRAVERSSNRIRREAILNSAEPIYGAG